MAIYTGRNNDTEGDSARQEVQSLVNQIAREQGGTESVFVDGDKGNADKIPLDRDEVVRSDPQGFQYYDTPRRDSADYVDPYTGTPYHAGF